jgi:hypothetical protein
MFRPLPEYTRFSVRNIADSSSVGSRLDEVLAIFTAATPGATPWPPFALCGEGEFVGFLAAGAATVAAAGAGVGAGVSDPP